MNSSYLLAGSSLIAVLLLRYISRHLRVHSIAHLPGPPPGPWLVGNLPELLRPENVGDADFKWVKAFGASVRMKGPFGRDVLFTADPKALQYILGTSGYNFPKSPEFRFFIRLFTGKGLAWVEGDQHSRHRKIMDPAFSYSSVRAFLPIFQESSQRIVAKWRDVFAQSEGTSSIIDIPSWIARLALDTMGVAAFDYEFGVIDQGTNNELAKAYKNLLDTYQGLPDYMLAFQDVCGYLPEWMVFVLQSIPSRQSQVLCDYMSVARRVAQSLLDRQLASQAAGKEDGKDIMSLLVKANSSEDSKGKMANDEILAQLTTFMIAGHETSAVSVTWALYELSRHPEFQKQLRNEIKITHAQAAQRGDAQLTSTDLDSMKYLLALIKETLRYHPIVSTVTREAGRDDVIPLSTPQKTKQGEIITGIPVSKGQRVMLGFASYNRLKSVWGQDADIWRPERFLEGVESNEKTGLGVFANVATFGGGVRSCIGWRFAVIEMQAILAELVENFAFSPPAGNVEIRRAAGNIMIPMIKGSDADRVELPLAITPMM